MDKSILDDELWALIAPLLPPPKPRRAKYPGRLPLDDRAVLAGILFVLQSSIPCEMLPKELGCGSGMSCWRRLWAWQEAGVWMGLHALLLARLRLTDRIDLSRCIVDSASIRAVGAGQKLGRIPLTVLVQVRSTISSPKRRASRSRSIANARRYISIAAIWLLEKEPYVVQKVAPNNYRNISIFQL
jgi:transposase